MRSTYQGARSRSLQPGILDPNIDQDRLEMLYEQLSGILLQLPIPSNPSNWVP
ncbi:hypothetical protein ASPWEDRAFT_43548 [Aspergillus wentii DTO 134E9]|uniref:Uncharacterized protein n=1 Tax=Aspergillus wentii DTO 134E9 TaxID=1073089 RepID=A0A1L9REZ8_ASPWE|nr:uncharacterized protein ASPWEDRAFT_43548 [Aspergillus wentii DTO 134E9]OJJ33490.1 hypothetical protein ASPWEDRAFT_43548 [Aspergillus wentii DTO 134E9]